uniref:Polyprotein protein n=1 Tax=Solanum tuberosum TaxID=4113 RepID=M1DJ16_SOLTU
MSLICGLISNSPKRLASPTWTTVGLKKSEDGVCKTRRAHGLIGESSNRSTIPTLFADGAPELSGGLVKLDEVSTHLAYHRVVRRNMSRTNLDMPLRKRELGIFINEGETTPSKKERKEPPKGGKGKGKKLVSEAPGASATSQPTRITKAMILKIGNLAHSVDVRATRLEVAVPWMIESVILARLTPLQESIDTLIARVETCESRHGVISEMDDVVIDELEGKTDEEQTKVPEETIFGDLPDLEETIVQPVIQTSLTETSMQGPSGAISADIAPGTDAPTDGATV